jgi:phospholipid/cholesterol/gamma-HCH transport system substrate-binding protein
MTERTMRLRLGLFVIAAAALLATLILMFGSLPSLFTRSTRYTVRFTDAPGLTKGAPVRRSGVRIGTVSGIELDDARGIVLVHIAMNAPYKLRRSEQPTLVSGLLGGDTSIDLVAKQPEDREPVDREPLDPGSEVVGVRAATVNTLLRGASDVVPTTQETLNDIRKSIQRFERLAERYEKMTPLVEATVREYGELARAARSTIPEFLRTNAEIRDLATSARTALPELMRTNKEAEAFLRESRNMLPNLERTNDAFRDLVTDLRKNIPTARATIEDIGAAARNASRLTERADVMLQTNRPVIEQTLKDLSRVTEQAAKLLSDDNVRNASRTLTNVGSASEQLPKISRNADYIVEQGRETVRRLNSTLTQLEATLKDIQATTKPLGERSERITRNIDEMVIQFNQLVGDVRGLMRAIDRSDGTFKKFLTDPSLYNNIDSAAAMAKRLIPEMDRILKDFQVFADKLARHPELIGAGGIIRGSDGLKYPPTPPMNSHPTVVPAPGTPFLPGH